MMLEIHKFLYMEEATLETNAGFAEAQANMSKLARTICDDTGSKTGSLGGRNHHPPERFRINDS